MQILSTIEELKKVRNTVHSKVGFIPTMGCLHEGHISLVKLAQKENDFVTVSIFVNPKQFAPGEDFETYPRDIKKDSVMLEKAGVDILFLPTVEEMYPESFETSVSIEHLSNVLEGEKRKGHFTGVATVVLKLLNIVGPQHVYFGQKDAQQVVIVKKMIEDLQVPTSVTVGKTIREINGLAMSSRNVYLTKKEREEASILFIALTHAQELFIKGERNANMIKNAMKKILETTSGNIDYISIADPEGLEELKYIKKKALVCLAVFFGKTRLIDNIILE